MHIGNLSFCDRVGLNIRDDETKRRVMTLVAHALGVPEGEITRAWRTGSKPPGNGDGDDGDGIAAAVEAAAAARGGAKFTATALTLRSDGNPYLMCLIRIDGVDHTVFVDRKLNRAGTYTLPRMILSRTCFDLGPGAGAGFSLPTIVDGEIVRTVHSDGRAASWTFLANGCLVLHGQRVRGGWRGRRDAAADVLGRHVPTPGDVCAIETKQFFPATRDGLAAAIALRDALPYTCRGVYLFGDGDGAAAATPVLLNFDDSKVKTKKRLVKNDEGVRASSGPAQSAKTAAVKKPDEDAAAAGSVRVRSTDIPDAYEIAEGPRAGQYLPVPDIETSLYLFRLFEGHPVGTVLPVLPVLPVRT